MMNRRASTSPDSTVRDVSPGDAASRLQVIIAQDIIERAVALSFHHSPSAPYWKAREEIYLLEDTEERGRCFADLSRNMFTELSLDRPLIQALAEQPILAEQTSLCRVIPPNAAEEYAELFVADANEGNNGAAKTILLRLCHETLVDSDRLLAVLRHELSHIADMLNPAFGYDPAMPEAEGGPVHVNLILRRYRVLWDTSIDGRLVNLGRADASVRELRWGEFTSVFGMLGPSAEQFFDTWFTELSPTHNAMMKFATSPVAEGDDSRDSSKSGICPLCHFPFVQTRQTGSPMTPKIMAAIAEDFPRWRADDGLCLQCLEVYSAVSLSQAALAALPRA
jgi:hypothetical protein